MLDSLVRAAKSRGVERLVGEYIPTAKNKMVKRFYPDTLGFRLVYEDEDGLAKYDLDITEYTDKNKYIAVGKEDQYD